MALCIEHLCVCRPLHSMPKYALQYHNCPCPHTLTNKSIVLLPAIPIRARAHNEWSSITIIVHSRVLLPSQFIIICQYFIIDSNISIHNQQQPTTAIPYVPLRLFAYPSGAGAITIINIDALDFINCSVWGALAHAHTHTDTFRNRDTITIYRMPYQTVAIKFVELRWCTDEFRCELTQANTYILNVLYDFKRIVLYPSCEPLWATDIDYIVIDAVD